MKCSVCGSEYDGSGICPRCRARKHEDIVNFRTVTRPQLAELKSREARREIVGQLSETPAAGAPVTVTPIKENPKEEIKNVKEGDTVTFGAYEQNNDTSDGKEEIEWLVLEVTDGKALLISKYALDCCLPYHDTCEKITWEDCTLREWLNDAFLEEAFSAEERAMIVKANVRADENPDYSTDPGNATNDKVFLLSILEAEKYFSSDSARQCSATAYAEAQGAYTLNSGLCRWWLRSPGLSQISAASVDCVGSVSYFGDYVSTDYDAVRPALWINLDS